jgi:hypothetical protein
MNYTVVVDGVPILCESAAAAIALAREAASSGASVTQSGSPAISANGGAPSGSRWTEQRIKDFFRFIKPQQRKLVDALLETTDARTDEQLCQLLGVEDGRALAGVFTGVFKNAKKVGANPRELYLRHPVTFNDRRQFEYTLAESFRAAAKKWRST